MKSNHYHHRVDVLERDDRLTGPRMGRLQTEAVVSTGAMCRVSELAPEDIAAFGTEETRHTHRVSFKRDPGLTVSHVLRWAPPGGSAPTYLTVKGSRRPPYKGLPWIVSAERIESGAGS